MQNQVHPKTEHIFAMKAIGPDGRDYFKEVLSLHKSGRNRNIFIKLI